MKNEKFLFDIQARCGDISNEALSAAIVAERAFRCGWRGWPRGLFCVGECSWRFGKIGGGTPVPGPLFLSGWGPGACGFIGGGPGTGVLFTFCQISRSTCFTERLWATASEVA